ncbi:hypothetical protein NKH54_31270, partial [Mesorhizobium sp. M1004]
DWILAALDQLFHPAHDHSHIPSAERFAMGKELSEQILALNPPQGDSPKFRSYPAVARYYHENGNNDRAIELVELALTSLDGPEPIPAESKEQHLPDLLQALAKYRGCQGLLRCSLCGCAIQFPEGCQGAVGRGGKIKKGNWSKWLTGQFVHFPGVAAARRVHAALSRLFAAGSRLESS